MTALILPILMMTILQRYTLAVFYETLRCFPTTPEVTRLVKYDTVLTAKRFANGPNKHQILGEFSMNIPAKSIVVLDILGTHSNRTSPSLFTTIPNPFLSFICSFILGTGC